jgi:hypothetical protein
MSEAKMVCDARADALPRCRDRAGGQQSSVHPAERQAPGKKGDQDPYRPDYGCNRGRLAHIAVDEQNGNAHRDSKGKPQRIRIPPVQRPQDAEEDRSAHDARREQARDPHRLLDRLGDDRGRPHVQGADHGHIE